MLTFSLLGLQTLTASCKPLSTLHRGDMSLNVTANMANIAISDPRHSTKVWNFTTWNTITGNAAAGGATHGNVEYKHYILSLEEEARQRKIIEEWYRQIAAEVMLAIAIIKRDEDLSSSLTAASKDQGIPSLWKRFVARAKCYWGQWRGGEWVCDAPEPAGKGGGRW
jgi:hypothetical protein